jgi:hypothetical protein
MKTHYISNDCGRINCSCADNSHETYTWLLRCDYYPSKTYCADDPYIFTAGNMIYSSNNPYIVNIERGTNDSLYGVWCGTDVEMFKAITALSDKTDKHQYFVLETNVCHFDCDSKNIIPSGTFVLCHKDKWNIDVDADGTPSKFSSRNVPAHKATVTEILNHFLNNGTKTNIHTISL